MVKILRCPALRAALAELKKIVAQNEQIGERTVIFCEDRLSLAAERTVCAAVGGTFSTFVYTFARFLAVEEGKPERVLSAQGSAMAVRRVMEENSKNLKVFSGVNCLDAASAVYDTIALFISSGVTCDDVKGAAGAGGLLGGKLSDLALIYSEYIKYLAESGYADRNGYLKRLAPAAEKSEILRGAKIIFFGFQAFTGATKECIEAALSVAKDATGVFIGGGEDIYVNEAESAFSVAAKSFGGAEVIEAGDMASPEAERLRVSLFNPESYYRPPMPTNKVFIFEGADESEEFEFIAANRIPYYADRRIPLSEHPLSSFIFSYLSCLAAGCRRQDVDAAVSSPCFPAERHEKDAFRNYLLRFANYRGGVRREPDREFLTKNGRDYDAIMKVREQFLSGLKIISKGDICGAIENLLENFNVQKKLKEISEKYENDYPVHAAFGARAFDAASAVLKEAQKLCEGITSLKEIIKILKSGFAAMKVSLIPPKADAVFVGDLCATANTGSEVVFAAGLSGDVPRSGDDTALLTDREMDFLGRAGVDVSPRIRQVNARCRETAALNICAFKKRLYLSYSNADGESSKSEIIAYAGAAFSSPSGAPIKPLDMRRIFRTGRALPYYCSERAPALKQLKNGAIRPAELSAICKTLEERGLKDEADEAMTGRKRGDITCGGELYVNFGSVTPTALENYFSCPFLAFMRQGLKVTEREEGAMRPLDAGNFIHSVLQDLAFEADKTDDEKKFCALAESIAENKLKEPPYSAVADLKSGRYLSESLKKEAGKVALGMFRQIKVSGFKVAAAEKECRIRLASGVYVFGKTDRVDMCGNMVRIIDYKTGTVDGSPAKYYTGRKLQLPLYLLAAAEGKRPVGAYYFPASLEYGDKPTFFRLVGYMDGGEDVVSASDRTLQEGKKSEYFDAYLKGRKLDAAMDGESFENFLNYSLLVADGGVREMIQGNVTPSPAEGACAYCRMGGSCGYLSGRDGEERKTGSIKCAGIAAIAKGERGDE